MEKVEYAIFPKTRIDIRNEGSPKSSFLPSRGIAYMTSLSSPSRTANFLLKVLEAHMELHGAFKAGLSSLYGYTSDAAGIRHAILEESKLTFSDAKFMLVICSAFVNFLITKVAELNIKPPDAP